MKYRYQIAAGSETGHCCFAFTVVDTERPRSDTTGAPVAIGGRQCYEPVCECFEESDAKHVCASLNGGLNLYKASDSRLRSVLDMIADELVRRLGDEDEVKRTLHAWVDEAAEDAYQEWCM